MLILFRAALIASFFLTAGCLATVNSTVRSFAPVGLTDDTPVLAQINKQYKAPLFSIGADFDRHRNQSAGLGLISHAELEAYMNEQLDRLKTASGIAGLPGRAYLFADTSFGARASADGNIYIPISVVLDLESTDELTALLAHELAHTIRGHSSSEFFVTAQKKALKASSFFAGMRQSDTGIVRSSDMKTVEHVMASLVVADGFINPGWTRLQEEEADKLGMDLLVASGRNPEAMFVLLEKMERWEENNRQQQDERNALMEKALGSLTPVKNETGVDSLVNSYINQGATKLGAYLDGFNKNHDSAATRYETLLAYTDRHYIDLPSPAMETLRWNATGRGNYSKAIHRSLQRTGEASDALAQGDLRKAEQLMKSAVTPETNNQNFVRQTFFELRAAQGKSDSMSQNLQIGLDGAYPSLFLHVQNTQLKLRKGDGSSAEDAAQLLEVFDSYGRPGEYYNQILPLVRSGGMQSQAIMMLAECQIKYAGDGISCGEDSKEKARENDYSYEGLMKSFL